MTEIMASTSSIESGSEDDKLIHNKNPRRFTQHPLQNGYTHRLGFAIFAASLGMFNFGWNTAVVNSPQEIMRMFYNESHIKRTGSPLGNNLSLLWSFTVAVFAVGGMVGGLCGGALAEGLGRKKGMLVNTALGLVAAVLMALSYFANSYEMIIIGRFLVGINCGFSTVLTPTYNSEVAPLNIRGGIGTINQLGVTVGMLLAQVLSIQQVLGTENRWPALFGLAGLGPLLQLIFLPFCPESPRYLLLSKRDEGAAVKALTTLRGTSNVQDEIQEMYKEGDGPSEETQIHMCKLCSVKSLRLPLAVAILMHLSQQLSGINCIFYYSTGLFVNVGISKSSAEYATLGVGGIMVVMTLITIPLMDRAGRRTLHLTGLGGMLVFSAVFTATFKFGVQNDSHALQITAVVSALVIVVFFALGPGSIPWMIVPEFFSQGPRPGAVSVGVLINWLANFAVGLSFPPLQSALQELVFLPFTGFLLLFLILLAIYLPETKGRSFEEVAVLFAQRSGGKYADHALDKHDGEVVGGGIGSVPGASQGYHQYHSDTGVHKRNYDSTGSTDL